MTPKLTSKEKAQGQLLSLLTVFVKSNKSNNLSALRQFFQERLGSKADRAALNREINLMIGTIKKRTPAQKKYPKKLVSESVTPNHKDLSKIAIVTEVSAPPKAVAKVKLLDTIELIENATSFDEILAVLNTLEQKR